MDDEVSEIGSSSSTNQKEVQPTVKGFLDMKKKLTQTELDRMIVSYITESVLPFHHVESEAFKSFVKRLGLCSAPQLKIKSRKSYQKAAKNNFQDVKTELIARFATARKVALTIDHWSAHRRGFLGVTAHWFQGIERRNACIALRRVVGRCTYDVLAKLIDSIIAEYGLHGKISHCTTDSGSNFVKAFKEYQFINVDETEDDSETTLITEDNIECLPVPITRILTREDALSESEENNDDDRTPTLPPHLKCAAHRMSLIGSSDATAALENPVCKKIYRSLQGKLQSLFNKQNRSTLVSDAIKKHLDGLFVIPNATRWNSQYDAFCRVFELQQSRKAGMTTVFTELSLRPMDGNELVFLEEFVGVMRPLANALDLLQGEKMITAGHLLPTLYAILEDWEHMNHLQYTMPLVAQLSTGVRRRFSAELESDYFKIAAALHPSFKLNWCSSQEQRDSTIDLVINALKGYRKEDESVAQRE